MDPQVGRHNNSHLFKHGPSSNNISIQIGFEYINISVLHYVVKLIIDIARFTTRGLFPKTRSK